MRADVLNSNSGSYAGVADGVVKCLKISASYADFTDGGGAAGTIEDSSVIPKGSICLGTYVDVISPFTGDTSAVIAIGDGSDVDYFTTAANANVFDAGDEAMADNLDQSGAKLILADKSVTITVTAGSDWGAVDATANACVYIWYIEVPKFVG